MTVTDLSASLCLRRAVGRLAGSDQGSEARGDLQYYEAIEDGWLMLGNSVNPDVVLVQDGPAVRRATSWRCIWHDGGSGRTLHYAVFLPQCEDPDFVPCGVVFAFAQTARQREPEHYPVGLLHRSLVEVTSLDRHVWCDTGMGSTANVLLRSIAGTSLAWPAHASLIRGVFPAAYRIKRRIFKLALAAEPDRQASTYKLQLRSRNTFIDGPADGSEDTNDEHTMQAGRKRADSWPFLPVGGQELGSNQLARAIASAWESPGAMRHASSKVPANVELTQPEYCASEDGSINGTDGLTDFQRGLEDTDNPMFLEVPADLLPMPVGTHLLGGSCAPAEPTLTAPPNLPTPLPRIPDPSHVIASEPTWHLSVPPPSSPASPPISAEEEKLVQFGLSSPSSLLPHQLPWSASAAATSPWSPSTAGHPATPPAFPDLRHSPTPYAASVRKRAATSSSLQSPFDGLLPFIVVSDLGPLSATCRKLCRWSRVRVPSLWRMWYNSYMSYLGLPQVLEEPHCQRDAHAAGPGALEPTLQSITEEEPAAHLAAEAEKEHEEAPDVTSQPASRKQFPFRPKRVFMPRTHTSARVMAA
eukprot:CAMPEP_0206438302 /NCGR_PEP_ID=MMETSP0324_2-20121206/11551_1 /ASSEMBLY_ACC=CAM_ASM_000836 /TAXON_ID=2866 /ORGANISM="Crypthecodinium cohnii, Strain Seligo" /LENGTH=584 /DNA_ID=CAMNT_0053905739 /DNA_START=115 /DNA_END=1869 /DNA_ORIENTATION=+